MKMKDNCQKHKTNTPKNMRLSVVYADKEFQKTTITFKSNLIKYLIRSGFFKTPEDFTFCSKIIIDRVCDEDILNQYDKIIKDFPIKDTELWTYLGLSSITDKDHPVSIVFESKKYLTINIYPWAKKQDLVDSWHRIEELLKTCEGYAGKLRGPKDIKLIYAVSKARNRDESFSDIADALNENRLEGYRRQSDDTKEWDQWTLIDHFNRYKDIVVI